MKEYSDLDIDKMFIDEIMKSNAITLLPVYILNRMTFMITKIVKANKVLISHSQEPNTALITDFFNTKPVVA